MANIQVNNKNSDALHDNITSEYWFLKNNVFENTPAFLKEKYQITQHKLTKIVTDYSDALLRLEPCLECGSFICYPVSSQTEANQKINNHYYHYFCDRCKSRLNREIKLLDCDQSKLHKMRHAYKFKIWTRLEENELIIFKSVLAINSWTEFYREVVCLDFETIMPIVSKMAEIHLIDLYRNPLTNRIRELYILPQVLEFFNQADLIKRDDETESRLGKPRHVSRDIPKKYLK